MKILTFFLLLTFLPLSQADAVDRRDSVRDASLGFFQETEAIVSPRVQGRKTLKDVGDDFWKFLIS
jgi:hypothetical protein